MNRKWLILILVLFLCGCYAAVEEFVTKDEKRGIRSWGFPNAPKGKIGDLEIDPRLVPELWYKE